VDLIKTKTKASAMAQGNVGSVWSLIDEECIKIINDDSGSLSPCPPLRKGIFFAYTSYFDQQHLFSCEA